MEGTFTLWKGLSFSIYTTVVYPKPKHFSLVLGKVGKGLNICQVFFAVCVSTVEIDSFYHLSVIKTEIDGILPMETLEPSKSKWMHSFLQHKLAAVFGAAACAECGCQ